MIKLRRSLVVPLLTAVAAVGLNATPLAPRLASADVTPGGFASPNVTWLGNIPLDTLGIGGRIVDAGGQPRLYVTSLHGLSIYDISTPELPLLMGHLEMPHWENEDVAVSADGSTVLITHDQVVSQSTPGLLVIDASIPQAPLVTSRLDRTSHTVTCVDDACDWVYTSAGDIYDLRDKAAPIVAGSWESEAVTQIGRGLRQGGHDLNVDAAGLVTTDTLPRLVLDPTDPLHPVVVGHSAIQKTGDHEDIAGETAYQHNNHRPRADQYGSGGSASGLGPGELLLSNGETNFTGFCNGTTNGPFATWDMTGFDSGQDIEPIEVFRPVNSNLDADDQPWLDGNPAFNVLGCSGHWFDHTDVDGGPTPAPRDGSGDILVAASWYEHGTRFLQVDDATGDITEVGFFQPVMGSSFAAYWATDDIAYVVDSVRGVDILRFDRSAPAPTISAITQSWLANLDPAAVAISDEDRLYCQLSVS